MLGKRGRGDGMSRARCRLGHGMECEGRGGGGSARLEGEGEFETHAKRNGKRRNSDGTLLFERTRLTIAWFAFSPVRSLLGPRSFLSFHKLPTGHRPPSARARGIRTLSASAHKKVVRTQACQRCPRTLTPPFDHFRCGTVPQARVVPRDAPPLSSPPCLLPTSTPRTTSFPRQRHGPTLEEPPTWVLSPGPPP
jgi:hypothetical protein